MGIQKFIEYLIETDNNVSVLNPGGEMGRLVSTHEAPATPDFNPFLPVAKESDNGGVPVFEFFSPWYREDTRCGS